MAATTFVNASGSSVAIDNKLTAASVLASLKAATVDYAQDFSQEFQAPINGQRTSTVMIRVAPEVTLATLPSTVDASAGLDYTSFTGGSVEITLTGQKYAKLPIDSLGVKPGQVEQELGAAIGRAIVKAGNADVASTLEAGTTVDYFGKDFGVTSKSTDVWPALVAETVAIKEAEIDLAGFRVYIRPAVWAKLIADVEVLRTSVDPHATAAKLLGVGLVREVNLTSALAVFAHQGAVAQARVLSGVDTQKVEFTTNILAAIKYGTKILNQNSVRVLADGVEPTP